MIEHTLGEMNATAVIGGFLVLPRHRASVKDVVGNCYLITKAHEAPHECADPDCPGNVNRRKLEDFDGLLETCEALFGFASHADDCSIYNSSGEGVCRDCTCLLAKIPAQIAKAKE